jgi:hypothetical protein
LTIVEFFYFEEHMILSLSPLFISILGNIHVTYGWSLPLKLPYDPEFVATFVIAISLVGCICTMSYSSYGNERLPFPFQDDLGSEVLAPDNQNVPSKSGTNTDPCLPRQSSSASSRSALESYVEQHTQPNVDVENFPAQSSSSTSLSSVKKFAEIAAIQESCMRALIDPDQELALRLWNQSLEDMKNHYAPDVEKALSGEHQPTTNAPGNGGISVVSQIQDSSGGLGNIHNSGRVVSIEVDSLLEQIKHPMDPHMRLIYIKGHIPAIRCT